MGFLKTIEKLLSVFMCIERDVSSSTPVILAINSSYKSRVLVYSISYMIVLTEIQSGFA